MTPYEQEFHSRLEAVGSDASACVAHVYSELAFHHLAGDDPDLRDAVNEHAGFWNRVLGSQQAAAFVAMGRLYDTRADARSLNYLLEYAETYVGIFSRASLVSRKIAQGMSAADARTYVTDTHEVRTGGF